MMISVGALKTEWISVLDHSRRRSTVRQRLDCLALSVISLLFIGLASAATAEPPVVTPLSIIAPASGTAVSAGEQVEIQVIVGKGVRASAVQITYDGKGIALLNKPPFTATWDTTGMKGGSYVIQASVFLDTGVKLAAVPVEVIIEAKAEVAKIVAQPTSITLTEGTPGVIVKSGVQGY